MMLNAVISMMGGYHPDASAYFARRAVQLSASEKTVYNNFFIAVNAKYSTTSISQLADCLWIMRGSSQADARLNLIKSAHTISEVNTPTYDSTLGYTGTATGYLDLNYNPSTQGVNFTLNNGSWGYYDRTAAGGGRRVIGSNDGTRVLTSIPIDAGLHFAGINGPLSNTATTNGKAHFHSSRVASNQIKIYRDGTLLTTIANNSSAIPNLNCYGLTYNVSGVAQTPRIDQLTVIYFARGLFEINAELQTLATALGFNN